MSAWIANLEPAHIRRSSEAVAACRKLLLLDGAALDEETAIEDAVEVIVCHMRIVTLTGRLSDDAKEAFAVAVNHTMTERELSLQGLV